MNMITDTTAGMSEFQTPSTMTPHTLGDHLARLVWESFTDFIEGEAEGLLRQIGAGTEEGLDQKITEEMLIFLMWAHTRAVQLAFVGRVSQELLREALDAMHRAVFEDMVENGTPRSQLPLFEQRVSARYSEYYAAAEESDVRVGEIALQHMAGALEASDPELVSLALTERALIVANPLKDYLEDVKLEG